MTKWDKKSLRFEAKDDGFYDKLTKITYAYDKEIIEVLLNSLFSQTLRFGQYKQEYEQKVTETLQQCSDKYLDIEHGDDPLRYATEVIDEIAEKLGVELK